MAENFSIEHSRTKITEVKKTIEDKKQKLDELKQQKKSLMDAGLALDSSNLDSAVQATLMESINDSLRDVENKAYDVSKDANQNLQSLEQIRQNVDDEITDSQKAKKKLDQTKKLLDTLGVGKSLEKGVNKLDDHLQEATGLKGEVISAMRCSFFKSLEERDAIDPTKKQPILPPQRKIQSRTKAALLSAPGENP